MKGGFMKRREAREQAFKFLYQIQVQTDDIPAQREYFLRSCRDKFGFEDADISYITGVVDGVIKETAEFDRQISTCLKKWTVDRLPCVDLAILRLALYEIKYEHVAFSIIANEAVLLAKKYSTEESRSYINGILGKLMPKEDEQSVKDMAETEADEV